MKLRDLESLLKYCEQNKISRDSYASFHYYGGDLDAMVVLIPKLNSSESNIFLIARTSTAPDGSEFFSWEPATRKDLQIRIQWDKDNDIL